MKIGDGLNRSMIMMLIVFCLLTGLTIGATDHTSFFDEPDEVFGPDRNCQTCHTKQGGELMNSVHYMWRSENPNVEYPGGGAHGMIDRACGLVGSNAMINYDESCGRCHVGDSLPFPDPSTGQFTTEQKTNLDCMICHAPDGMYDTNNDGVYELGELSDEKVKVDGKWHQERSNMAAQSVGNRVSNQACLRCHHHGQADYHYKRGTPYTPDTDVHANADMFCTDCHEVDAHKMARGSKTTDMFAWEMKDVEVSCEKCHTDAPHKKIKMLNMHTDKIGCKTCHIPEVSGAQRRIWAPTMGLTEGPESQVPIWDEASGKWLPYSEYDQQLVSPTYRWHAGGASMLAEPIANPGAFDMQPATRQTTGAKILPFRKFISGQPMDALGIAQMPDTFDSNFTMAAALNQMADALKQAGFMRPEGMTPQEEAMMSQFPNMLLFDRQEYFATGDVSAAVSIGMAKMGAFMMGMDISGMTKQQLIGMGSQMWSGSIAGLDLPDNPFAPGYIPDMDPTTSTGSYITVSHAVKLEGALNCKDCHTENGRLDFAALGYSPEKQEKLITLSGVDHSDFIGESYEGPKQCVVCHEGAMEAVMSGAHYKFESDQPAAYQFDEHGNEVTHTKTGKLWKLCGFPTTLPQFNWLGALKDLPETDHVDVPGGCAQCHIGTGVKPFTATGNSAPTEAEHENVDCLICHSDQYNRKYYIATAGGEPVMSPLNSPVVMTVPQADGVRDWSVYTEAARTVGPTSAKTCNRCHAAAGGGKITLEDGTETSFKRGSVYAPGKDVHASAGLTCSDCHYAGDHKFKRPLNNDLSAHDVIVDHQMCTDCHTDKPHKSEIYNSHLDKIACTTCHATAEKAAVVKDFSVSKAPDPNDPLGLYKPGMQFASPVPIEYKWFNGTVGPEITARGDMNDGKIYPFRTVEFNQPVDADNNPVPVKWGVFFKTGNMEAAANKGRSLYDAMFSPEKQAKYGIPSVPGPFDHYNAGHNGGFSVSHGITKVNALRCGDCHTDSGKLDFAALGYSPERQAELTQPDAIHAKIEKYEGPKTCVKCHEKEARDMFGSVHYQWNGQTPEVTNIDGKAGKNGTAFNTYCATINTTRRIVCWKCHVGYGKQVTEVLDSEQINNIDCLMCHQDKYKRKFAPTIPTGDINKDFKVNLGDLARMALEWNNEGPASPDVDLTYDGVLDSMDLLKLSASWLNRGGGEKLTYVGIDGVERTWTLPNESSGDITVVTDVANMQITPLEAAQTVHMPTRNSCLQCHATAGGGNNVKRGNLSTVSANPERSVDVHMSSEGGNLRCQDCHQTADHKVLGRGNDLRVSDRPERMTCDAQSCHSSTPHSDKRLDAHTSRVACQTCHIPTYGKAVATETHRDWLQPHWVQGVYGGQGGFKPAEYKASDLTPSYFWFDGTSYVQKLQTPAVMRPDGFYETAAPNGSVQSDDAKIYPFKEHTTNTAMHDATRRFIPFSVSKYFFTGNFDDAVADGLDYMGLAGDWSVVQAHASQTINHGVEPSGNALACGDCHAPLGTGERMDLTGKLGYALKEGEKSPCLQCHTEVPISSGFKSLHKLHIEEWDLGCGNCHNFQRPERKLTEDCTQCHN